MDPPPSDPTANGTKPAATADAAPPLEPPAPVARSQGFSAGGRPTGSVNPTSPNSGAVVAPRETPPSPTRGPRVARREPAPVASFAVITAWESVCSSLLKGREPLPETVPA